MSMRKRPDDALDGEALALEAARLGLDLKAEDPMIIDVRGKASYADYFVLLSGTNDRQTRAIADNIDDGLRKHGNRPVGIEGADRGQWVLMDYSDVVIHVFHQHARPFYDLEGLWADAPRVAVPDSTPAEH